MTKTWTFNKMYTRQQLLAYIEHLQDDLGVLSPNDSRDLVAAVESGAIPLREACSLLDNAISLGQVRAS